MIIITIRIERRGQRGRRGSAEGQPGVNPSVLRVHASDGADLSDLSSTHAQPMPTNSSPQDRA